MKKKKKAKKQAPKPKKAAKRSKAKAAKKPVKKSPKKQASLQKPAKAKPSGAYQTAFLSLGSNLGDREEYIEQAITLLKETPGIKFIRRSSNYETVPEGKKGQPQYINCVVEISTNIDPLKLLGLVLAFEDTLGRERGVSWGPRTIDIDILLFGNELISEDKLTVPHPLMHERLFVLEPLTEIAPNFMHPILDRTIKELYKDKKAETEEKYVEDLHGFKEGRSGIGEDYDRW